MVEKLIKAFEGFKNVQFNSSIEDKSLSKKEKMIFCVVAADVLVTLKMFNAQTLPSVIENMINLCDDQDADVRIMAEESLNRIIMSLSQFSVHKVLVELQKLLKKKVAARCLRAILSRFGNLSHFIRPNKGKAHAQMLIPSLIEIAKREEESIHETLASCFKNIFKVLGVFVVDNSLKSLIKAFLHNLSSVNPVIRRCSASCIITLVHYSRKPQIFNSYTLNSLLDCIVPVCENNSSDLILGVLGCLRLLLPNLYSLKNEESICGSFGQCRKQDDFALSVDRLIQVYEVCLHYTNNRDHNVVAAALETLNQLFENLPVQLETILLSSKGFSRSYINSVKEDKLWSRSGSEISVAFSVAPGDEALLLEDSDISVHFDNYYTKDIISEVSTSPSLSNLKFDSQLTEYSFKDKHLGKAREGLESFEADSDSESLATNEPNVGADFLIEMEANEKPEELEEDGDLRNVDELFSSSNYEEQRNTASIVDVGSFTDPDVPLVYCARHLAASFLLQGFPDCLIQDQAVRVSIKSLALTCLSSIIKLYPVIMTMNLAKNVNDIHTQGIYDILLYCNHCDPQIRGSIYVLVGLFIRSALVESKGFSSEWFDGQLSKLHCNYLVNIIVKGLGDKSSLCIRQALSAVKLFINKGLFSLYSRYFLPILEFLPTLKTNSYWLAKVKLVEVLSELSYTCIQYSTKSFCFQNEIVDFVLMHLLGDEDSRVRTATAEGMARIIPILYYGKSTTLECVIPLMSHLDRWVNNCGKRYAHETPHYPPFAFLTMDVKESEFDPKIEKSLSRIVAKLSSCLLAPENKYFLYGYIEALKLLSEKYPPTLYPTGWHFSKKIIQNSGDNVPASQLTATVLSLLLTSPYLMDLAAYTNATFLLGNLFAGLSLIYLKKNRLVAMDLSPGESIKLWSIFTSEWVSYLAEEIFSHLLKLLNMISSLSEETALSRVGDSTPTTSAFLPSLSPVKRQEKKEDKIAEKRQKSYSFKSTTQYAKLRVLLKNAVANYKVSLEPTAGNKFLDLLDSNLHSLSMVLEVATVRETGHCAEEILSYLLGVVSFRPCSSIACVLQLLKSLFGANLSSDWEDKSFFPLDFDAMNIFDLFHLSTERLSEKIRIRSSFEPESLSGFNRKKDRKIIAKITDRIHLATYIRLFEPMVVKSLQLYSITSDLKLQLNVLQLLNQLIQLRVNYCLLDENQVFVNFILKQFDLIEHGQIPGVEELLPHIFKFLVLLSYQKQHSKPIMSIPKIIHLCDGLMASDQSIQTHCIPALRPVVESIFLTEGFLSPSEQKELETQREVLLSMLLRLVEFSEVMDMLSLILIESKSFAEREKWKRWSRQVMDTLIPLLSHDRLRIETFEGQVSLMQLMSSLSPIALRPVEPLLKALFVEPADSNCCTSVTRWISKATVLLETLVVVKEDVLLNRLEEITPQINLSTFDPHDESPSQDPFNVESFFEVFEPAETAARFVLKVIYVVAGKILQNVTSSILLQQKLSTFFIVVYHILKSGAFHRIKNALQKLLANDSKALAEICSAFRQMIHFYPSLICQFSYFLSLLNICHQAYWIKVLDKPYTLSSKLVQHCGVISLSDYLCENPSDSTTLSFLLKNNVEEFILLSHEIPVKELLSTIQRKKQDWSLLINVVSAKVSEHSESYFNEKALRILECSEGFHSSALLNLVINKLLGSPRLAVSLLAGTIACRQVEYLLTLSFEDLMKQIDKENFDVLSGFLSSERYLKRHLTLRVLLNKLSLKLQHHLVTAETKESSSTCTPSWNLQNVHVNENWYFDQVKQRCLNKKTRGREICELLDKLKFEKIVEIMSNLDFDKRNLKNCLDYSTASREKCETKEGECSTSKDSLFRASADCVWATVQGITENVKSVQNDFGTNSFNDQIFDHILGQKNLEKSVKEIAPSLTLLLELAYSEYSDVETEYLASLCSFAVLCLEIVRRNISQRKKEDNEAVFSKSVENYLRCCTAILKSRKTRQMLSTDESREILEGLLKNAFHETQTDFFPAVVINISNFELRSSLLMNCLREFTFYVCRIPDLNTRVLQVPESHEIQDEDLLENFISRFSVVGWSSRQTFEEIWMGLLSVLGFNTREDVVAEEGHFAVQGTAAAVEGITTLLKNTMLHPENNELIHHGRDSLSMKDVFDKIPHVGYIEGNRISERKSQHFTANLEMQQGKLRYCHGLLSVQYLWIAAKQINSHVDLYKRHSQGLVNAGLDLPSCIHLLTELYNQWMFQASPDIKIIASSLKSALVIADLFTDIAQFQWLQNFCFRIAKVIVDEDTVILPLVIMGFCKACAVILPTAEECEKVKKILLRSDSLPCRLATVRGLLYVLQSYVVYSNVSQKSSLPASSTFETGEATIVANMMDIFVPVAVDMVKHFKITPIPAMEEYDCCHWSLIFYLLQHYSSSLGSFKNELLNFVFEKLSDKNNSDIISTLLIKGSERLLLTTVTGETFKEQLMQISLEFMMRDSISVVTLSMQLLVVLSFLDKRVKDIRESVLGEEDPEKAMKDMEKVNVLFEKLKRSYPKEAEVVGEVISYVLMDFSPSDVLTKVIQEFLSPHQPHQKILTGLLFKVFERAETSLLEDWLVFSLPAFVRGLPVSISVWTLNCFFVSASSQPWLRYMFPYVQSRIRMADAEDKRLLYLSSAHFYQQLKKEEQKELFLQTFENASSYDNLFLELLSFLKEMR